MSEAIGSATIIAAARLVMLMGGLFMALVPMSAQSAESLQEKLLICQAVKGGTCHLVIMLAGCAGDRLRVMPLQRS
jgi:hypothetical protein